MASIDRTAYPRFKRVVSGRELAESFTPSQVEIGWAAWPYAVRSASAGAAGVVEVLSAARVLPEAG